MNNLTLSAKEHFNQLFLEVLKEKASSMDFEVKETTVAKNYGTIKTYAVGKVDGNILANIYPEQYYDVCKEKGLTICDLVDEILTDVVAGLDRNFPDFSELLKDKNFILEHVVLIACNKDKAEEYLKDLVSFEVVGDISIYFKILFDFNDATGSISVSQAICKQANITEEELKEAAIRNTKPELLSMTDMLSPFTQTSEEEFAINSLNDGYMTVLTNSSRRYGAGVLGASKLFDELCDKIDDDIVIIPSSIHELILLPYTCVSEGLDYISDIIKSVNSEVLSDEDFLSDNLLIYKKEIGFQVVNTFAC